MRRVRAAGLVLAAVASLGTVTACGDDGAGVREIEDGSGSGTGSGSTGSGSEESGSEESGSEESE
jgi:hypothetical protein